MKPPIDEAESKSNEEPLTHSEKCKKDRCILKSWYFPDMKEKEARGRFTGGEIILYKLNKLNLNVFNYLFLLQFY